MQAPERVSGTDGPADGSLRCLIVGAGQAGRSIARDLRHTTGYGLEPVAFLDDDPRHDSYMGLPVVGGLDELVEAAYALGIDVVVLAIPGLPPAGVHSLVAAAASIGLGVRYLPSFLAALERDARIDDLRRLRVDRLLGRGEVRVVRSHNREVLEGKRVLVTGAGGSIGSELCRQIKAFDPGMVYMLDHDESNLHRLQMDLNGRALLDRDELIIADIRDAARIRQLFRDLRPQVVFHAAAHKHLPLLELHPAEGVKTNVIGTLNLAEAAVESDTETFILISTDKAADPTSVLGATKRLAEYIVQSRIDGATTFASVRFGNVLGSRGSFLSTLLEQIQGGAPVTITHPDVTRFFMTIEEAVGLVLEAAGMAERGETYILDMGEPVRIIDLVRNTAAELHVDESDLTIEYTGLRPGEKLNESLFSKDEERVPTAHPRVWATRPAVRHEGFEVALSDLYEAAAENQSERVWEMLRRVLPDYRPAGQTVAARTLQEALVSVYPDGF